MAIVSVTCLTFASGAAWTNAETHALLVGVSRYPTLPAHRQLLGPANDVREFKALLNAAGVTRVRVLAQVGDAEPTRRNILTGLEQLLGQSAVGDTLVAFFAGHGAQQPVPRTTPNEPDGLDEIFLPQDVGRWNARTKSVDNAIVDDEFARWVAVARERGRHVWLIFDTCHAGDMAKALPKPDQRMREVPPFELGIPASIPSTVRAAKSLSGASPSQGKNLSQPATRFVALYAAEANEPTPEETLVMDGKTQPMGVFTAALLTARRSNTGALTAGAWVQAVKARYRAERRVFPSPWAEGDLTAAVPWVSR